MRHTYDVDRWIRIVTGGRLQVRIHFNGNRHNLGVFPSHYEAMKAITAFWRTDKDTLGRTKYVKTFHTSRGTLHHARITYGGEVHDLGRFEVYEEASQAVIAFVRKRWPNTFDEVMRRR